MAFPAAEWVAGYVGIGTPDNGDSPWTPLVDIGIGRASSSVYQYVDVPIKGSGDFHVLTANEEGNYGVVYPDGPGGVGNRPSSRFAIQYASLFVVSADGASELYISQSAQQNLGESNTSPAFQFDNSSTSVVGTDITTTDGKTFTLGSGLYHARLLITLIRL